MCIRDSISLINNVQTEARINQFLQESIINGIMPIGDYINAHVKEDTTTLNSVYNAYANNDLNEGEGISNLTFHFDNNTDPLTIHDVYRRFSITKFYDDFTSYMVKNGSKSEDNQDKYADRKSIIPITTYKDNDIILSVGRTIHNTANPQYNFVVAILGNGEITRKGGVYKGVYPTKVSKEVIDEIVSMGMEINISDSIPKPFLHDGPSCSLTVYGHPISIDYCGLKNEAVAKLLYYVNSEVVLPSN